MRRYIPQGGMAFGLVGGAGFIVDGGILTVLSAGLGVNLYAARACSFLSATAITWYLNRTYAFGQPRRDRQEMREEYLRYLIIQIGGGILNFSIFVGLAYYLPWMKTIPVLPLAIGAIFSMVFTYATSRFWVFRKLDQR